MTQNSPSVSTDSFSQHHLLYISIQSIMPFIEEDRRASTSTVDATTTAASSPSEAEFKCPYASSKHTRQTTRQTTSSSLYYQIEDDPTNPHCYRRPTESDIRGPCPALNTLANHGYLPRDGNNITPKMFLKALQHPDTYHCTAPLARVLVYGGFLLLFQNGKFPKSISLHDIALHNRIEHDASVVHRNTPNGEKYAPIDVDITLLEHFLIEDFVAIERVAHRRVELEVASPINGLHSEIARGEWSLVLGIFGRATKGQIDSDILNVWLHENRFVTGWKPSHKQTLIHTVSTSSKIRQRMNKYKPIYLKKKNEPRKDAYIQDALEGKESESEKV